ncbi:MAG TPA: hypothetical protein VFP98_10475, partial [Candidatus Polarisedimenticolia bacterium]|nr:hypothetical protein [Candidatus Polarisedimenticolia bacterium]
MSRKGRLHALLPGLLIALFLLAAVEWSLSVPPYEAPDETGHARYVDFLRLHRRLPLAGEEAPGEAHQPPLYYALAALAAGAAGLPALDAAPRKNPSFVWYGGSDQAKYLHDDSETPPLAGSAAGLHWLRFLSVLMAAPAVWLFHRIAAAGAGAAGPAPIAAAGLAAFLPQFTFISGSLNNDNLANLLSAGCFALLAAVV